MIFFHDTDDMESIIKYDSVKYFMSWTVVW
jgi:hypothetical protein